MPPSKYERELRFIDTEVARMSRKLKDMAEAIPDSPAEAAKKADEVLGIQDKIAAMLARKREIEDSFIQAGMELPDIGRSMNATVHNASGFEVRSSEEAESLAGLSEKPAASPKTTDVQSEIKSIGEELAAIETKLMEAEIDGNDAEVEKLKMMSSSLRARRDALVQEAKQQKAEKPAPAPAADEETMKRIADLEADNRALRSQVSGVRSDVQDVKDQLRQIMAALGIDQE